MRPVVLFYNPRAVFFTMPLALIAVGSALDPSRYDVRIVDGRLEADPVRALLDATAGALCLGVTVLTGAPLRDALAVTRAVKAARPGLPVIWGGWHPSLFPEQCLTEPGVDAVVIGQGEDTFAEIVERLSAGRALDGVAGCVIRQGDALAHGLPRPLRDVNDLPAQDYGLIDVERYFGLKGKRQLDYISSQGCRFRCTFCADPFVYKRGWYGIAPERMVRELAALHERHPFDEVAFQDETFFTSARRVEEVSDVMLAAGLAVQWTATMRADQGQRLGDAALAKAKRAGLRRVMIGVEAGSDEMLRRIKKDITLAQVLESAHKCMRHRIGIIFNLIVGFPHEPEASVDASLAIARRLRSMSQDFEAAIFFFRPYPGNEIAADLLHEGYRFPQTLEAWAEFDYIAGRSEWVSPATWNKVERFKFYQKHAYGPDGRLVRRVLKVLSRWRIEKDQYAFPVEQRLVEWLRPAPRLS
jgi:radical SAM superfamily enzyme YgiQ (UPF0313 family)